MDNDAKKTVLRMMPNGLCVLTGESSDGQVAAATVNWVTQDAALEIARRGVMYLLGLYHSHFYPNIPKTIEPVVEAGIAFVGTGDDVRRQLAEVRERLNPEYFLVSATRGCCHSTT